MKTKLFSLFLALVASVGIAFASNSEVDGIWYNFNSSTYTAEVTYRGVKYDSYSDEYSGNVTIPASVTYSGKKYSVTSIGAWAFFKCDNLWSVTIPNSITSIGERAFSGCSDLTSITIPNSVTSIGDYAFAECKRLTSMTIPNSVTSIGDYAFYECTNLPVVDNIRYADWCLVEAIDKTRATYAIKEGAKWICSYAFSGCTSLTSITIPNSVTSIGRNAFSTCSSLTSITIPNSVTSIGRNAFDGCKITSIDFTGTIEAWCSKAWSPLSVSSSGYQLSLNGKLQENITIPNSITSIRDQAFARCRSLKSMTIPNSVTSIGSGAFYDCSSLRSATIPNSITSIEGSTFSGCGITSVTIPSSVTSIGKRAFEFCGDLTSITIPSSITSIGEEAFNSCRSLSSVYISDIAAWCAIDFESRTIPGITYELYGLNNPLMYAKHLYLNNTETTDLVIPDGITSIKKYAFYGCSFLTSVTISNSVTSIEEQAFDGCSGLTSVSIPNSVTSIGGAAFRDCSGLTSVTIGNGVTSIGNSAFDGCGGLTSVTCKALTPPQMVVPAFDERDTYSSYYLCEYLYVPAESVDAYRKADGWKYFENISAITDDAVEDVLSDDAQSTKVLRDGKVLILRGDKTYTVQGQEVR